MTLVRMFALVFLMLLTGCQTAPVADRSDRPWMGKPAEVAVARTPLAAPAPLQTWPILCEVEGSPIIGLQWGLERSTDLKVWTLVQTIPAPMAGGTVMFTATNDAAWADYRVRTVYPP
jgi:hypothetical protein